ncbi:hypothetical protein SAMN05720354_11948 [Nitrosospira sp. Nsp1]|nr:hypothetical protein SAMN05720354_11948 [Nitrosospira sp. Nsp1]
MPLCFGIKAQSNESCSRKTTRAVDNEGMSAYWTVEDELVSGGPGGAVGLKESQRKRDWLRADFADFEGQ